MEHSQRDMTEDSEDSEDYTSSSGSSSDDEDSEQNRSDAEEVSVNESATAMPFQLLMPSQSGRTATIPPSNLSNRLANFLPSIKAANVDLEREGENGLKSRSLEVGEDEDEQYVDMNLGLGVLEEVRDSSSEDSDDESSGGEAESTKSNDVGRSADKRKTDVMEDMMGRKKRSRPSIEMVAGENEGSKPE